MKKLVKAAPDEYGDLLREVVEKAYGFIFNDGLDLKTPRPRRSKKNSASRAFGQHRQQEHRVLPGLL
jgi:hypothetical protein